MLAFFPLLLTRGDGECGVMRLGSSVLLCTEKTHWVNFRLYPCLIFAIMNDVLIPFKKNDVLIRLRLVQEKFPEESSYTNRE